MAVAIADAFRNIRVIQPTVPEASITTVAAEVVGDTLSITAGLGITITADPETDTLVISNTGNGTGAYTEISDTNSNSTFYPLFSRPFEPTDINPLDVPPSYQLDAIYVDNTTNPMTYNPSSGTLSFVNASVTTSTISTHGFVGSAANLTRFPSAIVSVSNNGSGVSETTTNIGIIAEGLGTNAGNYGVGVYGVGYTAGNARGTGVTGEGHVTASSDSASAIGVRGYSNDTHASGLNVGLFADASGSSIGNYGLYINAGDINTTNVSPIWLLRDNQAASLSFDSAGKTGILLIKTTDAAEGITMSGTLAVTGHLTVEGVTSTGATGSGRFVFDNTPTLITPVLGVATATSINKMAITAPATGSTLAVEEGKTFTVKKSITLDGTDTTTITLPASTGTVALNNQQFYIGTTQVAINRASASLALTGVSIDGNAGTVTNGVYTSSSYSDPSWLTISATKVGLGNVENTALSTSTHYIGTTSIQYNRASANQSLTGVSIDGNAGTVTNGFYTSSSFNLGTTSIAVNRASATQSLTGVNIDGSAGSVANALTISTGLTLDTGTTFNGSAARTLTIDSTVTTLTGTQTLTNKRITQRVPSAGTTSGTLTPTGDASDMYSMTGLTGSITVAIPSGTPTDGQRLMLRFKDNGTARGITWTTSAGGFRAIGITLPTTTVISKWLYVGCIYNAVDSFWDVVSFSQQ